MAIKSRLMRKYMNSSFPNSEHQKLSCAVHPISLPMPRLKGSESLVSGVCLTQGSVVRKEAEISSKALMRKLMLITKSSVEGRLSQSYSSASKFLLTLLDSFMPPLKKIEDLLWTTKPSLHKAPDCNESSW